MRTRTVREGSVGLLLLLGVGLFVGLVAWLRGLTLGQQSYDAVVEFANVAGMQEGGAVRYRGVVVGNISQIRPRANGVEVVIAISPANLLIPRDVKVEANQSGLISDVSIDITPQEQLPTGLEVAEPLAPNCDESLIICDGSRLEGEIGISTDELIRYSTRFADVYSNPEVYQNINATLKNTSVAAAEVAQLTRELSSLTKATEKQLDNISVAVDQLTTTTNKTATQFGDTASQIESTAAQVDRLVTNVDDLVTTNRSTIVTALNNLSQTSEQLRTTVNNLSPTINRLNEGELIQNLETLSANAAQASGNLRDISNSLSDPTNLLVLQQTLDSARVTFQNAQKISSDLDELTGDPAFRGNIRELVDGLSGLVSSTQQLEQQVQIAESLDSLTATANQHKAVTSSPDRQALIKQLKQNKQNSDSQQPALSILQILAEPIVSPPTEKKQTQAHTAN